jgi:hypothetical protein
VARIRCKRLRLATFGLPENFQREAPTLTRRGIAYCLLEHQRATAWWRELAKLGHLEISKVS